MRLILAALLCAALPAAAQETRPVTGTARVQGDATLPDEMVLAIEARGPLGVGVAEDWIDGNAVTDFALDLPAGIAAEISIALIGATGDGGRVAFTAGPLPVAAGSAPVDLGEVALAPYRTVAFQLLLDCGALRVGVGVAPGQVQDAIAVDVAGERLEMTAVPTETGARYELDGDPETFLWNQGETVTLSLRGAASECRPAPAMTYAAAGEGWSLVLTGNQSGFSRDVAFALTEGESLTEGALAAPVWQEGAAVLGAVEGGPAVRVLPAACPAGGLTLPHRVEVAQGDAVLAGCGGDAHALLTGGEWVVEDLGGQGIVDDSHLSLTFYADGSVGGAAGCNRWTGTFALEGGMTFGAAATTRMACAPALMAQEQAFTAALGGVAGYDIDATGALVLTDAAGAALVVARR